MATWVIHLRVADALRNRWQPLQTLPELPFVVGNLAPDGGVEVSPHVYAGFCNDPLDTDRKETGY